MTKIFKFYILQFTFFVNFLKYLFFFFGIVFVGNVSVISHVITESPILLPYLPLSKVYVIGFQKQFFTSTFSQTLHWHWHLLLFYFWLELYFVPSNLDLHSQNTGFVNVFYSFFLIIILKALKFLSFVCLEQIFYWMDQQEYSNFH